MCHNFFVYLKSETGAGKVYKVFVAIFLLLPLTLKAQEITPNGRFLSDTTKIGMPVTYVLSVRYPRQMDIVFPDSIHDYAPFEFDSKRYFPTKTDSIFSYDSAVYTLVTFELDTVQRLRLPVYMVSRGDSIPMYTAEDSVILEHVVKDLPDTLQAEEVPLKEFTDYLPVALQFNYPYLIIGILILIIIILLVLFIFGKRIKIWWKLQKMKRQYSSFQKRYHKVVQDDKLQPVEKANKAVVVWKNYMEKLTGYPYAKWTTREVSSYNPDENLKRALRQFDKLIYSGKATRVEASSYADVEEYTSKEYNKHVEGLKDE